MRFCAFRQYDRPTDERNARALPARSASDRTTTTTTHVLRICMRPAGAKSMSGARGFTWPGARARVAHVHAYKTVNLIYIILPRLAARAVRSLDGRTRIRIRISSPPTLLLLLPGPLRPSRGCVARLGRALAHARIHNLRTMKTHPHARARAPGASQQAPNATLTGAQRRRNMIVI